MINFWYFIAALSGMVSAHIIIKANGSLPTWLKVILGILSSVISGVLVGMTEQIWRFLM